MLPLFAGTTGRDSKRHQPLPVVARHLCPYHSYPTLFYRSLLSRVLRNDSCKPAQVAGSFLDGVLLLGLASFFTAGGSAGEDSFVLFFDSPSESSFSFAAACRFCISFLGLLCL